MDRTQQIAEAFDRLFRTYPQTDRGIDAAALLTDRARRASAYFEAIEPYETNDILVAIRNFITGSAPGINPAFAPSAPMVGAECRRVMNLRLDSERRAHRPALPEPPRVSPERRREMGHILAQLANRLRSRGDAA